MIKTTYVDHMGTDLSVVNAARVSFGKKVKEMSEGDERLIKFLADHGHISPFGHCFMSFHIYAPVFVRAQLVKHKFLRVNEISRRYVDEKPVFYEPDCWRERAENKKQGSGFPVSLIYQDLATYDTSEANKKAQRSYEALLAYGVAPEQARMVLPQSMMTEWYWSGSLDAFAAMANLRLKGDAQYESRVVAQQIDEIANELYPFSWRALVK